MNEAIKTINQVIDEITPFTKRPMARSQEEITHWRNDPAEYFSRKVQLTEPFPDELKSRVQEALDAWDEIEKRLLDGLKQSRDDFLVFFEDVLARSSEDGSLPEDQAYKSWDMRLGSFVTNISWPQAFMGYIPAGAPEFSGRSKKVGCMVTAVYALEMIGKHTNHRMSGFGDTLKELKAYYRF